MSGSVVYPREKWEWFGSPGHLIVSFDCRFHLHTLVGPWVVSTVGEWCPDSSSWDIYADSCGVTLTGRGDARRASFLNEVGFLEIGSGRKYETMVFRATGKRCERDECRCGQPEWSGSELDSDGYNERGDAQRGHYAMCDKWATIPADSGCEPHGAPNCWLCEVGA